jgi:cytochrome c553
VKDALRKSARSSLSQPGLFSLFVIFVLTIDASSVGAGPLDTPGAQKSMVCSACHGFAGNPPGKTVPALAGMDQEQFKAQIRAFAEGRRQSPEMEPYAKYVLEFGLDEIAGYFAAQKKPAPVKAAAKEKPKL